jgi:hypothetical protein
MVSVDRDTINQVSTTTGLAAVPQGKDLFGDSVLFTADAFPVFAESFPIGGQTLDAAYCRGLNGGRGVVGEGGDTGPGVVGIAGKVIARAPNGPGLPHNLLLGPFPGRGFRAGVIGLGQGLSSSLSNSTPPGGAIGVLGMSDLNVGVIGASGAHVGVFGSSVGNAGIYGVSASKAVVGDGRTGAVGVEGVAKQWGVYGHVDFAAPNPDGAGVFGAAAFDFASHSWIGRAGLFAGPVDVSDDLSVAGNLVVFGTKSAAARHDDGTHRLLYCVESPESQFEDFGEAKLVKGKAEVRLDRDFIAVADTRHYHVFLTPYGDSNGLYVVTRRATGFQVREQGGGKATLAFSYRIVAKRKHAVTKRFSKTSAPKKPKLPVDLAPPQVDLDLSTRTGARPIKKKKAAVRKRVSTQR